MFGLWRAANFVARLREKRSHHARQTNVKSLSILDARERGLNEVLRRIDFRGLIEQPEKSGDGVDALGIDWTRVVADFASFDAADNKINNQAIFFSNGHNTYSKDVRTTHTA